MRVNYLSMSFTITELALWKSYVNEISLKDMDKSTNQTTTGTAKRKLWAYFLEHIVAEYRQTP